MGGRVTFKGAPKTSVPEFTCAPYRAQHLACRYAFVYIYSQLERCTLGLNLSATRAWRRVVGYMHAFLKRAMVP